jgi:hypothetical protein
MQILIKIIFKQFQKIHFQQFGESSEIVQKLAKIIDPLKVLF